MTEQQQREIAAPQKWHQRKAVLVGVSDRPPDKQDRERKYQRLGHDPGKTEALTAKPRIDLANDQGTNHPSLDQEPSPKQRHATATQPKTRRPQRRLITVTRSGEKWKLRQL